MKKILIIAVLYLLCFKVDAQNLSNSVLNSLAFPNHSATKVKGFSTSLSGPDTSSNIYLPTAKAVNDRIRALGGGGGGSFGRKVDSLYKVNDSTVAFLISGALYSIIIPGEPVHAVVKFPFVGYSGNSGNPDSIGCPTCFSTGSGASPIRTATSLAHILAHDTDSTVTQFYTTGTGGNVALSVAPAFTNPTVTTQSPYNNSTRAASTAYVDYEAGLGTLTITSAGSAGTLSRQRISYIFVDPSGALGATSTTTPASPQNGDEIIIYAGGQIAATSSVCTAYTLTANSGQSIYGVTFSVALLGGDEYRLIYDANISKWKAKKL